MALSADFYVDVFYIGAVFIFSQKKSMRTLSKSGFKLGLDCSRKLYYSGDDTYSNRKVEDDFLKSLAEGGFQVEELARLHYPNGILLEESNNDYQHLADKTAELLKNENVVIYEAAFLYENLFVRTDIVVKKGNHISLIEVKAKSFDSTAIDRDFYSKDGLQKGWKPYFFDLAFQCYVVRSCLSAMTVSAYFMMADKSKKASIDGLNQLFRITSKAGNRTGIIKLVDSIEECGDFVLSEVEVTKDIDKIISGQLPYDKTRSFSSELKKLAHVHINRQYPQERLEYSKCRKCEFRNTSGDKTKKSGVEQCLAGLGWTEMDESKPTLFEMWNYRSGKKVMEEGRFYMSELREDEFREKEKEGLSVANRQWVQVEKRIRRDSSPYIDREGISNEMKKWNFPYHLIDFETSTVALPFTKGMRPYEQVAFQFSHHLLHEDGRVEHAGQFLCDDVGVFPNFMFVRELKRQLEGDEGTIFHFATHENTILVAISKQLAVSQEGDKDELIDFIASITTQEESGGVKKRGSRALVDLRRVYLSYYYHPLTKGSNSIKYVLPAFLTTSTFLKAKYANPISTIGLSSLNFQGDHIWLKEEKGNVLNPYKLLPPVFVGYTPDELDDFMSEMDQLAGGGAALTAYAKLQYSDMPIEERKALRKALLKYCELDTLAMLMIVEEFRVI
jgi:hypothetical protein